MNKKVRDSILRMLRKASVFSMGNPDAKINVQLMGKHDFGLWFFFGDDCEIVKRPVLEGHIDSYEKEVDRVLQDIKAKFLDPKQTWIKVNAELNE